MSRATLATLKSSDLRSDKACRARLVVLKVTGLLALTSVAFAQDAEKFAEGKAAMNHQDCAAARRAFESESAAARDSAVWLDAVAQASECTGDVRAALGYLSKRPKELWQAAA